MSAINHPNRNTLSNTMDCSDICRVCMEEVENFISVFKEIKCFNKDLMPALLISQCAGVSIDPHDGLPDLICSNCMDAILKAYIIREKCIASDRKLRKILFSKSNLKTTKMHTEKEQQNSTAEDGIALSETPSDIIDDTIGGDAVVKLELTCDSYHSEQESNAVEESSFMFSETEYTESESYELGELIPIKKELVTVQDSFFEEEYLVDEGRDLSEDETTENALDDISTHAEKGTIQMEVEIFNQLSAIDAPKPSSTKQTKKFECDICKQEFSTKGNLKSHLQLHFKVLSFNCEVCGKKFAKKSNLKIHLARHSTNRPYHCSLCDKSFACHLNLNNHLRKHTDDRQFACSYCSKAFKYLSDKIRHEYSHTGKHPYSCEVCHKKFSRSNLLKKHIERCNRKNAKTPVNTQL